MEKFRLYLYIVLPCAVISFSYWSLFGANALYTFHEYSDLGTFAYNMYFDLHYAGIAHGLQLLIFGNHVAPDLLLMLPFYALAQSPMTLLVIQSFVLAVTGVVVFVVAADLTRRPLLALAFSLAFFLNPGVFGMLVFDFHAESLLILFYVLTFYFFMKNNKAAFFASSLLLLGAIEEAPFLGATLAVVLLLYAYRFSRESRLRRDRLVMAGGLLLLSMVVFGAYIGIDSVLAGSYAAGQYNGLPAVLQAFPIVQNQINSGASAPFSELGYLFSGFYAQYTIYGVAIALFSFGFAVIFDPLSTAILVSPWFAELFFVGNINFPTVFNQYFGFVLGGTIVASLLAIHKLQNSEGHAASFLLGDRNSHPFVVRKLIPYSLVGMAVMLLLLFPLMVYSRNVNSFSQDFLFQVSPQMNQIYTQLYSVMAYLPQNASVMTQYFIMSHVTDRKDIELLQNQTYYFLPEYVLVDFNLNVSLNAYSNGEPQYIQGYIQNHTNDYALYARNGSAILLFYHPNVTSGGNAG